MWRFEKKTNSNEKAMSKENFVGCKESAGAKFLSNAGHFCQTNKFSHDFIF